ncbi:MAG: response regulator [Pyrinomonadaceae bacterium]|nr:response regulator [Pyrinomonadaceae bacterium]
MNFNEIDVNPDSQTQQIFQDVFSFFGTLTPDGRIKSLFGEAIERAGINAELLVGQPFAENVFWQSSEQNSEMVRKAVEKAGMGERSKLAVDFRVSSKEKMIVELFIHPFFSPQREVDRLIFCANEVTTRENEIAYYKEKSEHLLFAAENADVGLWYWDLRAGKIHTTPKCNELFLLEPNDILTLDKFYELVHPDDKARVEGQILESQNYGKEYHSEFRVIYPDGTEEWIAAQGKTFLGEDGTPKNMMGVVQKVTDTKTESTELSKIYAREKKLRDEAEEANRAKDFFLAVISHELRSPLNAILGWTKILLTKELDTETRRKALETVEKSARSQAKLLDDLLDSSRVASGRLKLEFRDINLYEVISTVYNLQKPTADAKSIEINIDSNSDNIRVFGDPIRIQQVITNLLSNALKFTPDGGKVNIEIQSGETEVIVHVADTGQGISQKTLPNIFRQFRQGDADSGDQGGLGLGLSIAKILIEKHKGKIWATSEGVGQGSTFSIALPLLVSQKKRESEAKIEKLPEMKLLNGIKILVVEDEPDSREVLQLFLEQNGAEVKSVDIASQALEYLSRNNQDLPDIILSDLAMPGMDGYALLSQIRQLKPEQGGDVPAVALSAFSSNDNKQRAFKSGFQQYHTKPFEPDGIIQDILNLTKKN